MRIQIPWKGVGVVRVPPKAGPHGKGNLLGISHTDISASKRKSLTPPLHLVMDPKRAPAVSAERSLWCPCASPCIRACYIECFSGTAKGGGAYVFAIPAYDTTCAWPFLYVRSRVAQVWPKRSTETKTLWRRYFVPSTRTIPVSEHMERWNERHKKFVIYLVFPNRLYQTPKQFRLDRGFNKRNSIGLLYKLRVYRDCHYE